MPHCIQTRWLVGWLLGALAFAGCASDTSTTGDLQLELELLDGTEIDEVTYSITGNEMEPMVGTINTGAPGSTASVEVYGIPAGENYEVAMTATSTDGETSCSGSAEFDVAIGLVTQVMVVLNCKPNEQYGGVRVNGKFNFCADLMKVVVSPLQTSVGNQIDVLAQAVDLEGDPIEYLWTGTGGSFADPSAPETTYTCEEVGEQTITITVSDDGFRYCDCSWTVDVRCVDGSGGGGTGGMGGQAGAGGEGGSGGGGTGGAAGAGGMGGQGGTGGAAGMGGEGGTGGAAGAGGMGGQGGTGGAAGMGGEGGSGGTAGMGGEGGTGGAAGAGGMGGQGGTGGTGGCVPDKGARDAGMASRDCAGTDPCGAFEVCVDGTCEEAALVFVSSRLSNAALMGPRGADAICADLARDAGLGGYWMSWTSDECTSPAKRFHRSTIEYRLINGEQVAANWTDLTDGEIDRPIGIDENGIKLTETCKVPGENEFCFVWTNTTIEGFTHFNDGCLGLTSDNGAINPPPPGFDWAPAQSGYWISSQNGWTARQTKDCAFNDQAIYCFEQPASNQ